MTTAFFTTHRRKSLATTLALTCLALTSCVSGPSEQSAEHTATPTSATIRIGTGITPETRHAAYLYAAALQQAGYSVEVTETGATREELFDSMGIDTNSPATADPSATEPAEDRIHIVPDLSGDLLLYLTNNGKISPTELEESRESARITPSGSPTSASPQLTETLAGPTPSASPSPTAPPLNVRGLSGSDIISYVQKSLPETVEMLDSSVATNRYGYAITSATAQKYGIRNMEDLGEHCKELAFTVQPTFTSNPAGAASLDTYYGCTPGKTIENDDRSSRTWQLITDQAQVAYLYSTNSDIKRNNLTLLDDPQGTQLAQNIIPLTRAGEIPEEAQNIVNRVSAQLDTPSLERLETLTTGENPISETDAANFWLDSVKE